MDGEKASKRIMYYLAEQDEVGHPHWEETFSGQMLYGYAEQELVDGIDWLTYKLVLEEGLRVQEAEIRRIESGAVKIDFVSREALLSSIPRA